MSKNQNRNVMKLIPLIFLLLFSSLNADISSFLSCNSTDFQYDGKASYLYMGVAEDQLGFAVEGLIFEDTGPTKARLKSHHPKWDSGVKLELGLTPCSYPLKGIGSWTYFQTSSKAKAHSLQDGTRTVGITTVSAISGESLFPKAEKANSTWDITLNEFVFDIKFIGDIFPCFSVDPYVGVMGALINQSQIIHYNNILISQSTFNLKVKRKNHFYGVGPRVGTSLSYTFWDDFRLISDFNTAFLVGVIHSKNKVKITPAATNVFKEPEENLRRGRPMLSASIGIEWNSCLCNCYNVSLAASYQYQYFFSQWHSTSNLLNDVITGEGSYGDLSLQGLSLTGGIVF